MWNPDLIDDELEDESDLALDDDTEIDGIPIPWEPS
jgi:hypothetical protein